MASFSKRYGKWQARITWFDDQGGKHQKAKNGFPTKQAAKQYAAKIEAQRLNGIQIKADPAFIDYYKQWFTTYKKPKISDNTARHYKLVGNLIQKFFGKKKLKTIKRIDFQKFINDYGQNHSPESVKKVYTISHACIRSAITDGIIYRDVADQVAVTADESRSMHVQYLSLSEIKNLLETAKDGRNPAYTSRYLIIAAIYTGARLSELAGLTWKDVDFKKHLVSINKAWDYLHHGGFTKTKNKSSVRTIRVNTNFLSALNELKANGSTLVFMNADHTIPTSNAVNKELRFLLKKAGLYKRDFHFHSLRHSHVAYLLSQGVDLYSISKRLGHSNMMTTGKVYAYLIDEYQEKQNDEIENKLQKL